MRVVALVEFVRYPRMVLGLVGLVVRLPAI